MEIKKSGELKGVSVCVDNGIPCVEFFAEYPEGRYSHIVRQDEKPSVALDALISGCDLAVSNMDVLFAYIDYDRMIAFQCVVWHKDTLFLKDAVAVLDDGMQDFVLSIFENTKPNFTDEDTLKIVDRIHGSRKDLTVSSSFGTLLNPAQWRNFKDVLYSEMIELVPFKVVEYASSWKLDGCGMCQGGSRMVQLDPDYCNRRGEVLYGIGDIIETDGPSLIWDANTCIDIADEQYAIHVLCGLKNIGIFKSWTIGFGFPHTWAIKDICVLACSAEYIDKKYCRYGMRVDVILEEVRKFDEYLMERRKRIFGMRTLVDNEESA